MKLKVNYVTEIKTEGCVIKPDGFSCICFQNIGATNAILLDHIPLLPDGAERNFRNEPEQIISTDITLRFTETNKIRKILIVKTYYELQ